MKNDAVNFAYIQGKHICIKPVLHIVQLIVYSFGEFLSCVGVILDICIISEKVKFQTPSDIWWIIDK